MTSIVEGEYAENEIRKDFLKSERKAIGETLEEHYREEERRGNPNLKKSNDSTISEPVRELKKGQRTTDLVAEKIGLGSGRSYEQLKNAVNNGTSDLVAAMDADRVSIKDAELLSRLPEDQQKEILSKDEKGIRQRQPS